MSVPLPCRWPAAAAGLLLTVGIAAAQPPNLDTDLKQLLDLKPAAAADGDSALAKLRKERFNTLVRLVQARVRMYQNGAASVTEVADAVNRLAQSGADLEVEPARRQKWVELRLNLLRHQEQAAQQALQAGTGNETEYLLIRAARLDAEIDLQQLKDGDKKGAK